MKLLLKIKWKLISISEKEDLDINGSFYFYLARYSAIIGNKEIFEKSVFECLSTNKTFIVRFLSENDFLDIGKQEIINKVINKVTFTPIIKKLFENLLYRDTKKEEIEYFIKKTYNGSNENDIINELMQTDEYNKLNSIKNIFNITLEREATQKELTFYINNTLDDIKHNLENTHEFKLLKKKKEDKLEELRVENELKKDKFYLLKLTIKKLRNDEEIYIIY